MASIQFQYSALAFDPIDATPVMDTLTGSIGGVDIQGNTSIIGSVLFDIELWNPSACLFGTADSETVFETAYNAPVFDLIDVDPPMETTVIEAPFDGEVLQGNTSLFGSYSPGLMLGTFSICLFPPIPPVPPVVPAIPSSTAGGGLGLCICSCSGLQNWCYKSLPPTEYDAHLKDLKRNWCEWSLRVRVNELKYHKPWFKMPMDGQVLNNNIAFQASSLAVNVNTSLIEFRIPIGWDGVINRIYHTYTGLGFEDGSGQLYWRLRVGSRYARNLGSIPFLYGSIASPFAIPGYGILVYSNQKVSYEVEKTDASINNGNIICGVVGWIWPRGCDLRSSLEQKTRYRRTNR